MREKRIGFQAVMKVLFCILVAFANSFNLTQRQLDSYREFLTDQQRLIDDIFKNYNPDESGLYTLRSSQFTNKTPEDHPPKIELNFQCVMLKLIDVIEKEEKVSFLFDYIVQWFDIRLTWNPEDYGGITHFYYPQKGLWIPEISMADAHDVTDFQSEQQKTAWVTYNGTVGYYTSCVPSVICQMDVFKFPLDSHVCSINILFHQCYKNEYEIINYPVNISLPISQLGNGEWQVEWINSTTSYYNGSVSDVQKTQAKIKRNPGFYISLIIIPAYFINALSIIALFINIDAIPEKFGIGLTNIMAMTFILAILADDLPKTRKIPLLAIYVIVSLIIIVSSLLSILILNNIRKLKWFSSKLKIEYFLMAGFQFANFMNFLVLFF